jgi:energy-coupling factor transporter transmembrane protein EcfT
MALGKPATNNTSEPNTTDFDETQKQDNDIYSILGKIIDTTVSVVGVVFFVPARILENFVDRNKPGIKILAALLFGLGVVMSADGFFQWFGGKPLFPWYEQTWISAGWFIVWFKVNFWAAVIVSLGVQWMESYALRSQPLDEAKKEYEQIKHHEVPKKNPNAVDLVELKRKSYKRAGMNEYSIFGIVILIVVLLDIAQAFTSRNPFGQEPIDFIGIVAYNVISIAASETGFILWNKANRKS